jgi:hypothetical protein
VRAGVPGSSLPGLGVRAQVGGASSLPASMASAASVSRTSGESLHSPTCCKQRYLRDGPPHRGLKRPRYPALRYRERGCAIHPQRTPVMRQR